MALDEYLDPRVGIAIIATALMLSPRVRRAARSGLASVGSTVKKVASTVVRGTRNLREAEKHVVKFGGEAEGEGQTDSVVGDAPSTEPPTP
jgi:hypothetical protein